MQRIILFLLILVLFMVSTGYGQSEEKRLIVVTMGGASDGDIKGVVKDIAEDFGIELKTYSFLPTGVAIEGLNSFLESIKKVEDQNYIFSLYETYAYSIVTLYKPKILNTKEKNRVNEILISNGYIWITGGGKGDSITLHDRDIDVNNIKKLVEVNGGDQSNINILLVGKSMGGIRVWYSVYSKASYFMNFNKIALVTVDPHGGVWGDGSDYTYNDDHSLKWRGAWEKNVNKFRTYNIYQQKTGRIKGASFPDAYENVKLDHDGIWHSNIDASSATKKRIKAAFRFLTITPSMDIIGVKKFLTDTDKTEVHILKQKTKYQGYSLQAKTELNETGDNFTFVSGDYNRDGYLDIFAIKKYNTTIGKTAVHILAGETNYKKYLLRTGTKLNETGDNFIFLSGYYNYDPYIDIIAIKKNKTGTGSTEVHVLDGKSDYQTYLLNTGTKHPETGDNFDFVSGDYNNDGYLDIIAIKKYNTGTGSTEVRILNGATTYSNYLLNSGTILPETGDNHEFISGDYNNDGFLDIAVIIKHNYNSTSDKTVVKILDGKKKYQGSFLFRKATILGETYNDWKFIAGDSSIKTIHNAAKNVDPVFDPAFYYYRYSDLQTAIGYDISALKGHWKAHGKEEGRVASATFDVRYYLNSYPGLKEKYGKDYEAAINHYLNHGIDEGRKQTSPVFDVVYYKNKYAGIAKMSNYNAVMHFIRHGMFEGRQGCASFNVKTYLNRYPHLRKAFGWDYRKAIYHYLAIGIKKGLSGKP